VKVSGQAACFPKRLALEAFKSFQLADCEDENHWLNYLFAGGYYQLKYKLYELIGLSCILMGGCWVSITQFFLHYQNSAAQNCVACSLSAM
jgi:hypothetical protein